MRESSAPVLDYDFRAEIDRTVDTTEILSALERYESAIKSGHEDEIRRGIDEVLVAIEKLGQDHQLEPENYNEVLDELDHNLPDSKTMIRGARIERILPALMDEENLKIGYHGPYNRPYPNAASGNIDGLRAAFEQSSVHQPGMRTATVFESDHVSRERFPENPNYWQVTGEVPPKDLKHLLMRVPKKFFPEDRLTADEKLLYEKHPELKFVFRAFKKNSGREASH